MRRRPQTSFTRGFLRAAAVVVGLTVVILALILVVSSLTAPKAKAPAVPPTPTPGTPVLTPLTKITPPPTPVRTQTVKAGRKKKTSSMRSGASLADRVLAGRGSRWVSPAASPDARFVAYFRRTGDAYSSNPLLLLDRRSGQSHQIGHGDFLVRPVWSTDGRSLLYVRVANTKRFPGAEWSLVHVDRSGDESVLARAAALSLLPLGWSGGSVLYLTSTATDTSVYAVSPGHAPVFKSILFPQVTTGASLSPDGHTIAFAVPTSCRYCTVDVFHLVTLKTTYGPSGWGSQWNLAWTRDGRTLVTSGPRGLALLNAEDGSTRYAPAPRGLTRVWTHPMRATLNGSALQLLDTVTGAVYATAQ